MPYQITHEPQGAYKRFHGFVTAREFIQSAKDLQEHSHFDNLRYTINDFLAVEGFDVTEQDVEQMAILNLGAMQTNPNILIAVIAIDDRIRRLAEYFRTPMLASSITEIFSTVEAARAWLMGRNRKQPLVGRMPAF